MPSKGNARASGKARKTTVAQLAEAIGVPKAALRRKAAPPRVGLKKDDLSRQFFLDVTKSGHVFIREKGSGRSSTDGLPVFSTDTHEQAAMIRVHFCRLARDRSELYRLNECLGDAELELPDLDAIAQRFAAHYERQVERHAHESPRAKAARAQREDP